MTFVFLNFAFKNHKYALFGPLSPEIRKLQADTLKQRNFKDHSRLAVKNLENG